MIKRIIISCLGFHRKIKRLIYTKLTYFTVGSCKGYLTVNEFSLIGKNVYLGSNVNFNGMKISGGGKVKIGDNFHSGRECLMVARIHNYDNGEKIPYDNTYIEKDIVIGDNVWLGHRVIILGGVTIGEGAIIQAGSVVVSNVESCAIVGGHPARFIKKRDEDHYYELKKLKKFH